MLLVLSLILGGACGLLYASLFVRRYAYLAQQSVPLFQSKSEKTENKSVTFSISFQSFFRHMMIVIILIILFLYIKLNLISWLIGFLFTFWYGVLSSVNQKRKE